MKGDAVAGEVSPRRARYLGVALASLANIFDPDVIVIGGGVSTVGDLLLEPGPPGAPDAGAAADEPDPGAAGGARAGGRDDRSGGDGSDRAGQGELRRCPGKLVVCPTPIGNLEDITLRVRRALYEADVIACEDTRRTGLLLERLEIQAMRLLSYHEGNEAERARELGPADRARGQRRARLRRRHARDL